MSAAASSGQEQQQEVPAAALHGGLLPALVPIPLHMLPRRRKAEEEGHRLQQPGWIGRPCTPRTTPGGGPG